MWETKSKLYSLTPLNRAKGFLWRFHMKCNKQNVYLSNSNLRDLCDFDICSAFIFVKKKLYKKQDDGNMIFSALTIGFYQYQEDFELIFFFSRQKKVRKNVCPSVSPENVRTNISGRPKFLRISRNEYRVIYNYHFLIFEKFSTFI